MLQIDDSLRPADLLPLIGRMWEASARSIDTVEVSWNPADGAPVFTVAGRYAVRGWTEWTQGFQFGSAILQYDATGEQRFLAFGRENTIRLMSPHVSHVGVHDHGFNNVSTYGHLRRLMLEGRIPRNDRELEFYEIALKVSGAVQAARWSEVGVPPSGGRAMHSIRSAPSKPAEAGTPTAARGGYIYSFNGPHSLFADTIRSLRSLALAHRLGHCLMAESDARVSLLDRLVQHAQATACWNIYYGEGRDAYDIYGRVAHESIFNRNDGRYRCPSTQQGYSPFTTWTRGLAWIMLGYAEQLEFLETCSDEELRPLGGRAEIESLWRTAATATCHFYLENTPTDGIPYWDTGAPGLARMEDYLDRPADPFNDYEPVDSSAAAIACQGLMRYGRYLMQDQSSESARYDGPRYFQSGLTILRSLLQTPYLNSDATHQGLLLHAVYHRPNGWDHIPEGRKVPCGESCQWGDYHLRETALYVQRLADNGQYLTFYGPEARERQT